MLGLDTIVIGDAADAWAEAGFSVHEKETAVGGLRLRFDTDADAAGPSWVLAVDDPGALPSSIDGLLTSGVEFGDAPSVTHPNGIDGLDHVVLRSPDLDRTTDALAGIGLDLRRTRDVGSGEHAFQQRFFRAGSAILELVGSADAHGDGPLAIWGLAFVSSDIDSTAASLGDRCSAPKDAVQPGRRIATIDTAALGISVTLAVMTPHVRGR